MTCLRHGLAVIALSLLSACTGQVSAPAATQAAADPDNNAPADSWLQGSTNERLQIVADQLRGFGMTMVEVGQRYGELHFAGQDGNWEYAAYQIAELEEAMAFGIQRRPQRAANAAMLAPALERLDDAVQTRDADAFGQAFDALTRTCNACHAAEGVGFAHVAPPMQRRGVIHAPPADGQ
ncbi:MAG: hypothetical protein Q4F49_06405 [Pseudoxanthomonas suwonensis]|nr:hypothetical protein [Pseudoxanthomonas suwonensis]